VGRNACGKLFCKPLENISEKSGIVEFFQHRDALAMSKLCDNWALNETLMRFSRRALFMRV